MRFLENQSETAVRARRETRSTEKEEVRETREESRDAAAGCPEPRARLIRGGRFINLFWF